MEDTKKFYTTNTKDNSYKFRGYLLPSESLEMSVNGQTASIIQFLKRGVIFAFADMKNQIIKCALHRINEIKGSLAASKINKFVKPLRHTILFDFLYRACGLAILH